MSALRLRAGALTNLQEGRPVDSGSEIPRPGRSPAFVHHVSALPGFPVACRSAPVHSDCIAPDSHRIPVSPALRRTPRRYNFISSRRPHYTKRERACQRNKLPTDQAVGDTGGQRLQPLSTAFRQARIKTRPQVRLRSGLLQLTAAAAALCGTLRRRAHPRAALSPVNAPHAEAAPFQARSRAAAERSTRADLRSRGTRATFCPQT